MVVQASVLEALHNFSLYRRPDKNLEKVMSNAHGVPMKGGGNSLKAKQLVLAVAMQAENLMALFISILQDSIITIQQGAMNPALATSTTPNPLLLTLKFHINDVCDLVVQRFQKPPPSLSPNKSMLPPQEVQKRLNAEGGIVRFPLTLLQLAGIQFGLSTATGMMSRLICTCPPKVVFARPPSDPRRKASQQVVVATSADVIFRLRFAFERYWPEVFRQAIENTLDTLKSTRDPRSIARIFTNLRMLIIHDQEEPPKVPEDRFEGPSTQELLIAHWDTIITKFFEIQSSPSSLNSSIHNHSHAHASRNRRARFAALQLLQSLVSVPCKVKEVMLTTSVMRVRSLDQILESGRVLQLCRSATHLFFEVVEERDQDTNKAMQTQNENAADAGGLTGVTGDEDVAMEEGELEGDAEMTEETGELNDQDLELVNDVESEDEAFLSNGDGDRVDAGDANGGGSGRRDQNEFNFETMRSRSVPVASQVVIQLSKMRDTCNLLLDMVLDRTIGPAVAGLSLSVNPTLVRDSSSSKRLPNGKPVLAPATVASTVGGASSKSSSADLHGKLLISAYNQDQARLVGGKGDKTMSTQGKMQPAKGSETDHNQDVHDMELSDRSYVIDLIHECIRVQAHPDSSKQALAYLTALRLRPSKSIPLTPPMKYEDMLPRVISLQRDVWVFGKFRDHPLYWDILELVASDRTAFATLIDVVRTLLAVLIGFWFQVQRNRKSGVGSMTTDFPYELDAAMRIMAILGKAKILPSNLRLASLLFPKIKGRDISQILHSVWHVLKQCYPLQPTPTFPPHPPHKSQQPVGVGNPVSTADSTLIPGLSTPVGGGGLPGRGASTTMGGGAAAEPIPGLPLQQQQTPVDPVVQHALGVVRDIVVRNLEKVGEVAVMFC
ncbi:Integrator complex subunit 5 [Quaeritorhiza haematococci]|nr:Integrator complex subunit 5 [Quaeritorhiza haematococci]